MAASSSATDPDTSGLLVKLASVLPIGHRFNIHHLSTPPFRTDALCSAVPGARPDRTYQESHFLAVSIDVAGSQKSSPSKNRVLVLAVEIYIFTTAFSTTLFVSKADSTGYLHLLNLPKATPSSIREIVSVFVAYLVEQRRRKGIQSIVSLFARAQDQYLFPGSIENPGKHRLDDRGLIRWWCRVLDPLVEASSTAADDVFANKDKRHTWCSAKAYLVIPGLDDYEARAFIPRTAAAATNWRIDHPLQLISHTTKEHNSVPPRCLIPRFPDDPKSRFRDELDDEAESWSTYREHGMWRSVKSLAQFWEMMAFRQECSGGHMTGFLWVVFDRAENDAKGVLPNVVKQAASQNTLPKRKDNVVPATNLSAEKNKAKKLQGPIQTRQPRIKTGALNHIPDIQLVTPYYAWPLAGRGNRIVTEADYKRSTELLLRLDFANLQIASTSTARWIDEVGAGMDWTRVVQGQRPLTEARKTAASTHDGTVNELGAGMVVRKKVKVAGGDMASTTTAPLIVNDLSTGIIRKKRKNASGEDG